MSTLHYAEWIAGVLVSVTLAGHALIWAHRKWKEAGRLLEELSRLDDDEE